MKIVIFSDSHGNKKLVEQVFSHSADAYVFLGDGIDEVLPYAKTHNVHLVKGNCDYTYASNSIPYEQVLQFKNVKMLICHGHTYDVKGGIGALKNTAISLDVQIACFGHSHIYFNEKINNITFLNPGSIAKPRDNISGFFVLEIENDNYEIKHIFLKNIVDNA